MMSSLSAKNTCTDTANALFMYKLVLILMGISKIGCIENVGESESLAFRVGGIVVDYTYFLMQLV